MERCKKVEANTRAMLQQQANKSGLEILSDRIEIQCSMNVLSQAKTLQIFLPFIDDLKSEETFFDKVSTGKIIYYLDEKHFLKSF